jgi:hypothetical protein
MSIKSLGCVVLLAVASWAFAEDLPVGEGNNGGYGITYVNGSLDELSLSGVLLSAASSNCFLTSIRVGGAEVCELAYFPWTLTCIRMRNNVLGNLMESSSTKNHYAVKTVGTKAFLQAFAPSTAPSNKKAGQDLSGSGKGGGSSAGFARTISRPVSMTTINGIARFISLSTLCSPTMPEGGLYMYYGEGDETDWGGSMWRAIISPYYTNMSTAGISLWASAVETAGFCGSDLDYVICFGGWGSKYPTSGTFSAKSPALSAVTAMWRAQEIHAAVSLTYGPYDTSLGFSVHSPLHTPQATVMGGGANLAPYSPASYMQWLHPGTPSSPSSNPNESCEILGEGSGTSPQVATQILSEMINKTYLEDNTLAFAYWPRFTCCMWCTRAVDSAIKHNVAEQSYDPTLTRKP